MKRRSILGLATQGTGGDDEARLRGLLAQVPTTLFPFDRAAKRRSFFRLLGNILRHRPDLVVMEGTGLSGGLALLLGWLMARVPYVIISGDAVGPFVAGRFPVLGPLFALYERLLCRCSAGYIGWTPYLAGRALSFGAPRAMTAAGWAPFPYSPERLAAGRARVRAALGIPPDALVFGIVGSLAWTRRVRYCYGHELIQALARLDRPEVRVLIVGDGSGRAHLERAAGDRLGRTIFLTGRVPRDQVPDHLAAMDVASLPQSVDRVGSFRYTTKLSEYVAAGLPVVTGQIPLAYDLGDDWLWRLPGEAPWDPTYIRALSELMLRLQPAELKARQAAVPRQLTQFDRDCQVNRVTAFVTDLLRERTAHELSA
ncbi:MAG TPA: glycosyltransferase [Gemmataceae bacterium]|jgi:glycosyltransferase involved in cell wall biosynthesis|nr:glycosyltransferase [Gemmataceae bacterium]